MPTLPTGHRPRHRLYSKKSLPSLESRRCDAGGMRVRHFVDTVQKLNCAAAASHALALRQKDSPAATTDYTGLNDTQDESTVSSGFFPVVFTDDEPPVDAPSVHHPGTRSDVTRPKRDNESHPLRRGLSFGKVSSYAHLTGTSSSSCLSSSQGSITSQDSAEWNDVQAVDVPFDERCFTYSPFHEWETDAPVSEGFVIEIPSNAQRSARVAAGRTSWRDNHLPVRRTMDLLNDDADQYERLVYNPSTTEPPTWADDALVDDALVDWESSDSVQQRPPSVEENGLNDNESTMTPPWIQRPGWDFPDDPPVTPRVMIPTVAVQRASSPVWSRPHKPCWFVPAHVGSSSRQLSNKLYTELEKPVALRSASSSTTVSGATCSQTTMSPSTPGSSKADHGQYCQHIDSGTSGDHGPSTPGTLDQQQIQWLISTIAATLDHSGVTYDDGEESSGPTSADQWLGRIHHAFSGAPFQTME